MPLSLNERGLAVAQSLTDAAELHRIGVHNIGGARLLDCGIQSAGGLQAGLALARICMAGLGDVTLVQGEVAGLPCTLVQVHTDQPVLACMASQYAGWQIAVGKYFAMGSGPMRAVYGGEELFQQIPGRERPSAAIGVLETRKLPTEEVIQMLATKLELAADRLTLLAAPTASIAGTLQVVARSVETCLHKLHELKFDLGKILSGWGTAPLPPVAVNDLKAIGRTNDAILYGGRVVLWVRATDDELAALGPSVPASASADYGAPFSSIFERYGGDFYKIDPMLFSPAVVVFHNLASGRTHQFGSVNAEVLRTSFS